MYRSLFHGSCSSLRLRSSSPIVKHSNLASSPAIMTTIAATVSTLASSPRFSSLISANQSIFQPKFSTASNSPTIISSLSSPAIIKPSLISENSIRHSSYNTYAHSSSNLSSLSSSPETSIMKPSVVTTRSYGRFPPMQGAIPVKPYDAMNTRTLNAKYAPPEEFPDTFIYLRISCCQFNSSMFFLQVLLRRSSLLCAKILILTQTGLHSRSTTYVPPT